MTDTPSGDREAGFPGGKAALCLGAGLLVALFAVFAITMHDNARRSALETTMETTAVGDSDYFPMPAVAPMPPYRPVAFLNGKPLAPMDYRRHEMPADDLTRAGVADKGGYIVYRAPSVAKDADDRQLGTVYFLKISPKEYLKVIQAAQ